MEPNAFIAEVYRRMSARNPAATEVPGWDKAQHDPNVEEIVGQLAPLLPSDKDARILDIGIGGAWFLAACVRLGYRNLEGADFGINAKQAIKNWSPAIRYLHDIETTIPDLLKDRARQYDFIHMSHVIEHIPKYSVLHTTDALYNALRENGTLLLRTPNMEGPCALSCFYVTLSHEYGFSGSNLRSLMELSNFDDVTLHSFPLVRPSVKQRIGALLRNRYLGWHAMKHRLFGVNKGGQFGIELVISGRRLHRPALFDERFQ